MTRAPSGLPSETVPNVNGGSSPLNTVRAQHQLRLEQLRTRLQHHIQNTNSSTQLSNSLELSPSSSADTPYIAEIIELTPTDRCNFRNVDKCMVNNNNNNHNNHNDRADDSEIRDLLLNHPHHTSRGNYSLRMPPVSISHHSPNKQVNVEKNMKVKSDHADLLASLGCGTHILDDMKNLSEYKDRDLFLFHFECTKCLVKESIFIDSNTPCVAYCPFCGSIQS
ncbi:uncharacterized protein TM35_000112520 [Trypanosoma theileri]|uniref:Uncharacterized protein n=1 Tax=Trypanosoma theileri TaxID=67003 RepID=A0A1X0NYT4_9TRYP|nr:uncharacterized protein TM35_000112520 [Trypanosoma theileri]ORC89718.1 hypothetical protein TM35_000112520 [Trypanosoma theileri]